MTDDSLDGLRRYYIDGHVHIGRSQAGQPVKISAAPGLTLPGVLDTAVDVKGIDIVGVIDAAATPVLADLDALLRCGELAEHPEGGFTYHDRVTLFAGAEVEFRGPNGGAAHFGVFAPDRRSLGELAAWLGIRQTNPGLSSQRVRDAAPTELAELARDFGGLFMVNHAFTPHRGLYGSCAAHMAEMVAPELVSALELGLSADTEMADRVSELADFTFVTNSDAHSLPKIAREYHVAMLEAPTFAAYRRALARSGAERVTANVGLWPPLGKYHPAACAKCGAVWQTGAGNCAACGGVRQTGGVSERLQSIADRATTWSPAHRPPYIHHIPLEWIPGIGPVLRQRLLAAFGTEMAVMNAASEDGLRAVAGARAADLIVRARDGRLALASGAGGRYGKIVL